MVSIVIKALMHWGICERFKVIDIKTYYRPLNLSTSFNTFSMDVSASTFDMDTSINGLLQIQKLKSCISVR